jgi:hypothetical protein
VTHFLLAPIGAMLLAQVAPQPAAAPAQPSEISAEAVEIPFNPPLGQDLAYRYSRTDLRLGERQTMVVDFIVSFRRDDDGYVMTVRHVEPGDGANSGAEGGLAALMRRPISVRVSADGEILSLIDPEGYWRATQAALDEYMTARSAPAQARQAVQTMIDRMRVLPPAEQLAQATQHFAPILEYAGGHFVRGEPIEVEQERDTPMGRLTQQFRVTLEGVSDGTARVVTLMTIPLEQLGRAGGDFVGMVVPQRGSEPLPFTAHQDRNLHIVSMTSGLAESWELERSFEIETDGARRRSVATRSLRRLR